MRAVYYERQGPAAEVLVVADVPQPKAGAGEVLVRVHVSGINPSDIKNRTGFASKMAFPRVIPHQDGAGVIEAVGRGVPADRIGERVWLYEAQTGRPFGTAAEYVAVPSTNAVPLPDAVSYETGASLGVPAITAHRCLFADGALKGKRVLVQGGAGSVGSGAIQLAVWSGAWVAATVRKPAQARIAREAGANLVVSMQEGDWEKAVLEATDGAGVDRIVEVDVAANLASDLAYLANGGVISAYSSNDTGATVAIPILDALLGNAAFRFVYVYKIPADAKSAAVADITACLQDGHYRPRVGGVFPLERAIEAHLAVESGQAGGKILLRLI